MIFRRWRHLAATTSMVCFLVVGLVLLAAPAMAGQGCGALRLPVSQ